MHAKFTHEADFRQERDFGAKIGATFEFLGAHWRPLGKCLLYFVLPIALLMGVGMGLVMNNMLNLMGDAQRNPQAVDPASMFGASYFSGMGLAMLGGMLAFLMLVNTVYAYVRLLLTSEFATPPAPAQVWLAMKPRLGRVLAAFGLILVAYVVILLLFAGIVAILDGLAFLLMVVMIPAMFYLAVPMALYFPVLLLEDGGPLAALRRSFYLAHGKWWSTFGLLLVAGLIQGMLTIVFALPQYGVMFGKMLKVPVLSSDAIGVVAQCLYTSGALLTYPISLMALVFQYFNLVERKEGVGLRTLVNRLGSGPAPVAHNQAYRPDEEGEY
ncbi:hypothetical protein [Hymenobacter psychrotolerans]|uniref:Membrane domain of glycerophosphoryl diester phosphodiesterase n=1 Tax=Hymenobacter psychrotolerans DSM 18569 TaxID=1121959 RepID=A0A1M6WJN1_9BACT|nr:hypothetical protein [Hymenobacter psychrotolerans]SHK93725.1 hypothetical protein SAMN02746009_01810 [Hymenobacter psychrotolerans DSM 18569]